MNEQPNAPTYAGQASSPMQPRMNHYPINPGMPTYPYPAQPMMNYPFGNTVQSYFPNHQGMENQQMSYQMGSPNFQNGYAFAPQQVDETFRRPQMPPPKNLPPTAANSSEILLDTSKKDITDPFVKEEVSEGFRGEAASPFVVTGRISRQVEESVVEVSAPPKPTAEVVELNSTAGRESGSLGMTNGDLSINSLPATPFPTVDRPDNASVYTNLTMTDQEPQSDEEEVDPTPQTRTNRSSFRSDREYHRMDSDGEIEEVHPVKTRISGTALPQRFLSGLRIRINDFRKMGLRKGTCRYKSSVDNKVCGREFRIPRNRIPMVRHQIANIRPHVLFHFKKPFYKCERCGLQFRRIKEHTSNDHPGCTPQFSVHLTDSQQQKLIDLIDECFPPLAIEPEMIYIDEDEDYDEENDANPSKRKRHSSRISETGSQTEKRKQQSVLNNTDDHIEAGTDDEDDEIQVDDDDDDSIFSEETGRRDSNPGPRVSTPVPVIDFDNISAIHHPSSASPKEFLNLCGRLTENANRKGIDEFCCNIEDCPDAQKIVNTDRQSLQKHILWHGKGSFYCTKCKHTFKNPKKPAHKCGGFRKPPIDDLRGENIPLVWKCFGRYLQD